MSSEGQYVYTVKEAAEFLRLGRTTVYDLIQKNELESIHIGSSHRITGAQLRRFLERKEQEGHA